MDHDRLFKELLSTFFLEFLELFLPDVSAALDRSGEVLLLHELPNPVGPPDLAPVAGPPAALAGDAASPPPAKTKQ